MKELMKKAHQMTREIVEKYADVDYKAQFALCLQVVLEDEKSSEVVSKKEANVRIEKGTVYNATRKQVGVLYANYKKGNLNISNEEVKFLYNEIADTFYFEEYSDEFNYLLTVSHHVNNALDMTFKGLYEEASAEIKKSLSIFKANDLKIQYHL